MATDPPSQPFPPEPYAEIAATHVRSLSALSMRLPNLLTTAATTLSQLTNSPIPASSTQNAPDTPAVRRAALSTTANTYFTAVLELHSALNAQIDQLQKHGVIPAEDVKFRAVAQTQNGGGPAGPAGPAQEQVTKDSQASVMNNGLGSYDVGVLNARVGVRQREEDGVLARVREVLRELAGETDREGKKEGEDEEMKDG